VDWICKSLVDVLGKEARPSLSRLDGRSGFSRQTVHSHLKHLVGAGTVSREFVKRGRGRPTVIYHLSRRPVEAVEGVDIVSLTFGRLKHACRFEKGGWCKGAKGKCSMENCPLTLKTK